MALQRVRSSQSAIALVIVLSFVVLLTGVVVAFLSLATTERQISNSSTNQTRADLLAAGATDTIIGDLKQEIAAGSLPAVTPAPTPVPTPNAAGPTPGPQPNLYTPISPLNAVPAQVGVYSGYPNVVKRSFYSGANPSTSSFFPANSSYPNAVPSDRAANVSTLTPSLDNRLISPARWNKPLLLPKANTTTNTDLTPLGATAATATTTPNWTIGSTSYAPNWVLVSRDGTNPTIWNNNLVVSNNNSTSVTGRYAYMVYNEGGLLDANVVGYPLGIPPAAAPLYASANSDPRAAYKGVLAFADLSQLPGISSLSLARQQGVINSLVGWRNYASAQPTGSLSAGAAGFDFTTGTPSALLNFTSAMQANSTGFLATNNRTVVNNQTDRLLASRQTLINLLLQGIAAQPPNTVAVTEQANLQTALQYLGTFSRDLNQPCYAPNANRPMTLALSGPDPATNGTNSAQHNDSVINPSFLSVRVNTSVVGGRNDGSDLLAGDPLVKKRFSLNRLAWLTYAGPIWNGSSYNVPTSVTTALKTTYGYTDAFLQQGTAANIYKSFGLIWGVDKRTTPVAGDGQSKWIYNHSTVAMPTSYTQTTNGVAMMRLSDVASAGREADFFELLKAAMAAGSKAKTAELATVATPGGYTAAQVKTVIPEPVQNGLDSTLEYAIIQVGANIIDQFDLDGFPTRILYNSPAYPALTREIVGVENLPYFYRMRSGLVQGRVPVGAEFTQSGGKLTSNGSVSDTGYNVIMQFPEIWNPHDSNSPRCASTAPGSGPLLDGSNHPLYPTNFRFVADTIDPDHIAASTAYTSSPLALGVAFSNSGLHGFSGFQGNDKSDFAYMKTNNVNTKPFTSQTEITANAFYMNAESTALTFTLDETATPAAKDYFREPTALMTANEPVNTMLKASGTANMLNPDTTTAPIANCLPSNHANIKDPAYMDMTTGAIKCVDGNYYLGIYLATVPLLWNENYTDIDAGGAKKEVTLAGNIWDAAGNTQNDAMAVTYRMQYKNPQESGKWATYDTKYTWMYVHDAFHSATSTNAYKQKPGTIFNNAGAGSINYSAAYDPRTSRFGMVYGVDGTTAGCPGSPGITDSPSTITAPAGWLDVTTAGGKSTVHTKVSSTTRPDYSKGDWLNNAKETTGYPALIPSAAGWNQLGYAFFGLLSQNNPTFNTNGRYYASYLGAASSTSPYYYSDPDGVVRRAMGAYVLDGATSSTGLPLATANTYSYSSSTGLTAVSGTAQLQSRPIVLNRPFQSVAELGYVFSGTPWKDLDFFTPESGDVALLDVFTVNDSTDATGLVAGKVDLNTRQLPVLQAIVGGAYKDEQMLNYTSTSPSWGSPVISTVPPPSSTLSEAAAVANALVTRTSNSTSVNMGPLTNVADVVGRYIGTGYTDPFSPANTTGYPNNSNSYDGFSNDLTKVWETRSSPPNPLASPTTNNISRLRSAPIRALTAAGETRVWNLMIDVIAQTGRYPATATSLPNFVVDGEQRYWVHVAIDRLTGQVIDKQIEIVKE